MCMYNLNSPDNLYKWLRRFAKYVISVNYMLNATNVTSAYIHMHISYPTCTRQASIVDSWLSKLLEFRFTSWSSKLLGFNREYDRFK